MNFLMRMQKREGGLFPATRHAQAEMDKFKDGDEIMFEARRRRNPKHHAKMMSLLGYLVASSDHFEDMTQAIRWAKEVAGHTESYLFWTGTKFEQRVAFKSISFAAMSQDDFAPFYEKVLTSIANLIGADPEEVRLHAEEYF